MSDREKVINGLECLAQKQEPMANPCSKCDYHDRPNFAFCVVDVATDALAMMKEQEPVKPRSVSRHGANPQIQHFCGNCNAILFHHKQRYCSHCGRAVKWND